MNNTLEPQDEGDVYFWLAILAVVAFAFHVMTAPGPWLPFGDLP